MQKEEKNKYTSWLFKLYCLVTPSPTKAQIDKRRKRLQRAQTLSPPKPPTQHPQRCAKSLSPTLLPKVSAHSFHLPRNDVEKDQVLETKYGKLLNVVYNLQQIIASQEKTISFLQNSLLAAEKAKQDALALAFEARQMLPLHSNIANSGEGPFSTPKTATKSQVFSPVLNEDEVIESFIDRFDATLESPLSSQLKFNDCEESVSEVSVEEELGREQPDATLSGGSQNSTTILRCEDKENIPNHSFDQPASSASTVSAGPVKLRPDSSRGRQSIRGTAEREQKEKKHQHLPTRSESHPSATPSQVPNPNVLLFGKSVLSASQAPR